MLILSFLSDGELCGWNPLVEGRHIGEERATQTIWRRFALGRVLFAERKNMLEGEGGGGGWEKLAL